MLSLTAPAGLARTSPPVASNTKKTERKRAIRARNMGRRRKAKQSVHSTLSAEELFAACGEPGKPAPKSAS